MALYVIIGILGLAVLMIVHEAGHYFAARAFGMRVTTFSIGFGPTFFKIIPQDGYYWFTTISGKVRLRLHRHIPEKHGPTVFQMGMIPFLAYVQIAGMNPLEEHDPEDKGSYANASLLARIVTIFAGPLANYLFASVFFFFSFYFGGLPAQVETADLDTTVSIVEDRPAARAELKDDDRIIAVNGTPVSKWDEMATQIQAHPAEEITLRVDRKGEEFDVAVKTDDEGGKGKIGVAPLVPRKPVSFGESLLLALKRPPEVVKDLVVGLGSWISGKADVQLSGPGVIVKEMARAAKRGIPDLLNLMGALSAYLGAFNLFPFPALDGGRLVFLGYELATRRRPNARIEARIHIVGFLMLIGLVLYVTIFNDLKLGEIAARRGSQLREIGVPRLFLAWLSALGVCALARVAHGADPSAPAPGTVPNPALDVPGPPSEPGLSHDGTLFDLEYTVASVEPTDVLSYEPIAGARAYAYAVRLTVETPLEPRSYYLGIAAGFAAASVPAGPTPGSGGRAFVAENPELWVRGLWSNRVGLSAGGTLGIVIPLPRAYSAVEAEVVRALRVVHPWDYPTFQNRTLTLRPSFEVRHVVGPLTLQARQGVDLAVVARDLAEREHRVELGGVGSQFVSVQALRELSLGLELAEIYALSADVSSPECPAPCDGHRIGLTLSPVVRLHGRHLSPSVSVLIPLLTPLRGEAASYFAARIDLDVEAPWGLSDAF